MEMEIQDALFLDTLGIRFHLRGKNECLSWTVARRTCYCYTTPM